MQWWQEIKARCDRAGTFVWSNRTKVAGYLGVIGGSVEMGITMREHVGLIVLGATVAAIGHYNDRDRRGE